MANLYFNEVSEHAVGIVDDHEGVPFPEGATSQAPWRYALQEGKAVDLFAGKTDEEAAVLFDQRKADQVAASKTAAEELERQKNAVTTRLDYLRRFTQAERIALNELDDAIVKDFLMMIQLAENINLLDKDTVGGTNYLEKKGYIGKGRAAEILAI